MEDSQAGVGSPVEEDSPGVEEGSLVVVVDTPVATEGNPAVGVDSSRRAEAGNREPVEDNRVVAGIQAVGDTRAAEDNRVEAGNQGAGEDSPVAGGTQVAVVGILVVAASRRKSYRTARKRYCRGLPGFGNWGRRWAAVCRTRYRISVRGRYWRRTWGILSIAAFHLSITIITIFKGNAIPMVYV